jgi:hypothetical protein
MGLASTAPATPTRRGLSYIVKSIAARVCFNRYKYICKHFVLCIDEKTHTSQQGSAFELPEAVTPPVPQTAAQFNPAVVAEFGDMSQRVLRWRRLALLLLDHQV